MDQPKRHSLRDAVPREWLASHDHAWLTLYSIAMGTEREFKLAKRVELPGALVLAFWGSMTYLDPSTLTLRFSPEGEIIAEGAISQRDSGLGAWLAVLQPCNTEAPSNEYDLKVKASVLTALLIGLTTRNYAYSKVAENCVSLTADQATAATSPILGPHGYDKPLRLRLDAFGAAASLLAQMPDSERRRIELSLHWYDKALRSIGVDSFLNNWIAVETLAMPDTSNVRPVNERLAAIYGMSYSDAAERFGVGKLLGLRSRIVHDGEDLTVHAQLADYMNLLYEDLLHAFLGLASKRLGEVAFARGFAFEQLLGAS